MSKTFVTPWTVAHQAPRSMGFPRQKHWSGLPFLFPGDLPDPEIEPISPALAGRFFSLSHQGNLYAKSLQLCPTLCDPVDCGPPGSSIHGVLQARILVWVAMPSFRGSFQPKDWTHVSFVAGRLFTTESLGTPKLVSYTPQNQMDNHRGGREGIQLEPGCELLNKVLAAPRCTPLTWKRGRHFWSRS